MTRFNTLFAAALIAIAFSNSAVAQSNKSSQQVSINVAEIAVIAVHGTINMNINTATAGQAPDPTSASATFDLSTNGKDKKISAKLDRKMPKGLTLYAQMDAPSKAKSAGKVELSDKSVDLLSKISNVRSSGLALNYEAVATVDATPDNVVRTVTYTITNN